MALTYSDLSAIAQNAIDKTLTNNVYSSTPILKRFSDKCKKLSGGLQIQVPVVSASATSGGYYSDIDTLTISKTENLSAAVYNWKQAYEAVRVSRLDLAKTSGDVGKLDLIASKIKVAEDSLSDRLSSGIFSDGTGSSGKEITGFEAMISATSTYGGIAPADMASWVAQVLGNSGTPRALSLALIQKLDGACTDGKQSPSLFVSQQNVYDEAYNLFTAFQRIESEEMGKLGFKSLMLNGKPLVVDANMKAGSIFALNEEFVHMFVHKDNDMRKEHHASLETTDSMLTKIFWMGNVGCSQRRRQGELADITVVA
jgi:hypothetical protein